MPEHFRVARRHFSDLQNVPNPSDASPAATREITAIDGGGPIVRITSLR